MAPGKDGQGYRQTRIPRGKRPGLARRIRALARAIADTADADQFAVTVAGVRGTGRADFEELVPCADLEALNGGRPARYRLTLVLHTEREDLGIVRIGTWRPAGFSEQQIERARGAAHLASLEIARMLGRDTPEQLRLPQPLEPKRDVGILIFDPGHHIRLLTAHAGAMLGWSVNAAAGASCERVLRCCDQEGRSLCKSCPIDMVLERVEEPVEATHVVSDARGRPHTVELRFRALPGREGAARVLATVRAVADSREGPASRELSTEPAEARVSSSSHR